TVRLWDAQSNLPLAVLTGHDANVQCVAISGDGKRVASGGDDRVIRLWNSETFALVKTLTGHSGTIDGLAYSSDDRLLASAGADGDVRLWTNSYESAAILKTDAARLKSVVFSPDNRWLFAGGADGALRIWECPGHRLVSTMPAHKNTIYSVA